MKRGNYSIWSFRLFVFLIIIYILVIAFVSNFMHINAIVYKNFQRNLNIISIITSILVVTGVVFTILSVLKKEEKNYKYYISVIGYPLLFIFSFFYNS